MMGHLPMICRHSEPAPNAAIIALERNKGNLIMDNVNSFGTFKSNELDIPPALDFKSTQVKSKKQSSQQLTVIDITLVHITQSSSLGRAA